MNFGKYESRIVLVGTGECLLEDSRLRLQGIVETLLRSVGLLAQADVAKLIERDYKVLMDRLTPVQNVSIRDFTDELNETFSENPTPKELSDFVVKYLNR